ncbi:hypothetical protein F2Q69_00021410 [Brassica cretica]|uniref:Uncharacterized protein n=1 Tax=Brassica cretica TaxID=69181 RepID=A0A8S9QKX2_BRACR|nr:hypothetical protein F2Q69_00021410 [Brassica cretica]
MGDVLNKGQKILEVRSGYGLSDVRHRPRPSRPGSGLTGTVLRLPRQDYYRYLFGFRIMPLGSWPLSSSYDVFYFYRKSLTCLERAGVGVVTQVLGFAAFHVWRSRVSIVSCISQYFCNNYTMCSLYCVARSILIHVLFTFGTLETPMRLRLHRGFRNWHVSYDAPCVRVSVGQSQSFSQQEPGVRCPARGLNDFSQPVCPLFLDFVLELGNNLCTQVWTVFKSGGEQISPG